MDPKIPGIVYKEAGKQWIGRYRELCIRRMVNSGSEDTGRCALGGWQTMDPRVLGVVYQEAGKQWIRGYQYILPPVCLVIHNVKV